VSGGTISFQLSALSFQPSYDINPSFFGYWCHLRDLVIPAKAGIYSANLWKCAVVGLDSRSRGNDRRLEWIPIPDDTGTLLRCRLRSAFEESQVQKARVSFWRALRLLGAGAFLLTPDS
jgi:hypothetical protein